jgi:membrane-associated HD superfamily phosphohydrolase
MKKLSDSNRLILIFALLSLLCFPILLAPPEAWLNIALLVSGIVLPFLFVGILLNRYSLLHNPYVKFIMSWLVGGVAFSLVSGVVLFLSNYSWQNVIFVSAKLGGIAMAISLLWHILSRAIKKFFSSKRR